MRGRNLGRTLELEGGDDGEVIRKEEGKYRRGRKRVFARPLDRLVPVSNGESFMSTRDSNRERAGVW
jgi:hypothetical protein